MQTPFSRWGNGAPSPCGMQTRKICPFLRLRGFPAWPLLWPGFLPCLVLFSPSPQIRTEGRSSSLAWPPSQGCFLALFVLRRAWQGA